MIKYHFAVQSMFDEGQTVEQDCYFNLTRDEMVAMLASDASGNPIARLMAAKSGMTQIELYMTLRDLIKAAYGVPNAARTGLRKNPRLVEDFLGSPFMDALMDKLTSSEEESIRFFKGITPPGIDVEKELEKAKKDA
jgi:hypothetical protein